MVIIGKYFVFSYWVGLGKVCAVLGLTNYTVKFKYCFIEIYQSKTSHPAMAGDRSMRNNYRMISIDNISYTLKGRLALSETLYKS